MIATTLVAEVRRKICHEIDIEQEGDDRFIIFSPFMFDDGDHFVTILKRQDGRWWLTDEGHTLMHMDYEQTDFRSPSRWKVIENALANHQIQLSGSELRTPMDEPFQADRIFSFFQGIARITNVTAMTREMVSAAFMEDFRELMRETLPSGTYQFNYVDSAHDPQGMYPIDCRIDAAGKSWAVFGVGTDDKCNLTALTCKQHSEWDPAFQSVVIYRNIWEMAHRPAGRLTNVANKQFSSINDQDAIREFFHRQIQLSAGEA